LPIPTFPKYSSSQTLLISKKKIPVQSWKFRQAFPTELATIENTLSLQIKEVKIVGESTKKQIALIKKSYDNSSEDGTSTTYIVLGRENNGPWTQRSTFEEETFEGFHNLYLDLDGDGIPEFIARGYGGRGATIKSLAGDMK
jgi:hypothetical protein